MTETKAKKLLVRFGSLTGAKREAVRSVALQLGLPIRDGEDGAFDVEIRDPFDAYRLGAFTAVRMGSRKVG